MLRMASLTAPIIPNCCSPRPKNVLRTKVIADCPRQSCRGKRAYSGGSGGKRPAAKGHGLGWFRGLGAK